MGAPQFNAPLTDLPQAESVDLPSGAKVSASQASFFQDLSNLFAEEGQAVAQRQLQEQEQQARQMAEERGRKEGLQAAKENEAPEQRKESTLFNRVFNEQAIDTFNDQVYTEFRTDARKLAEEHETDPAGFKESFEEMAQGYLDEMPTETVERMRPTIQRTRQMLMSRINENATQKQLQENKAKYRRMKQEKKSEITVASRQLANGEISMDQYKNILNDGVLRFVKYGPSGEKFNVAGQEFQNGNGLFNSQEIKNEVAGLRAHAAAKSIEGRFVKSQNKQDFISRYASTIEKPEPDRNQFKITRFLSADQEQALLENMRKNFSDLQQVGKMQANRIKQKARLMEDQLLQGQPVNDDEFNQVLTGLTQMGEESALNLRNDLRRARNVRPVAEQSWSFTNLRQFNQSIQQKQKRIENKELTSEQRDALNQQIDFLQEKKSEFQSQMNNNMIGYAKRQGDKIVNAYSESRLNEMANQFGMDKSELVNRLRVEDITFQPVTDEEGNIVGVTDETKESLKERFRDAVFVSQRFGRKMDVFTESERKRFNRFIGDLDAEQKNQVKRQFVQAMNSPDQSLQTAAFRALEELSGDKDADGNPVFVQSAAVSATNPEAGKNILIGQEVRSQTEANLIPGSEGNFEKFARDILINRLGTAKGMTPPTEKINRVLDSSKNLAAYDVFKNKVQPDAVMSKARVRKYVDKALGGKNNQGGTGVLGGDQVILPPKLTESEANAWISRLANPPGKVDGEGTVTLQEFAAIMPETVEAQELAQFTEFDQTSSLNKEQLSSLMNRIGQTGMSIPTFDQNKKEFSPEDADKLINKLKPSRTMEKRLFSEDRNPFRVLSMNGQAPKYPNGTDFTIDDFQNEYSEDTIDFVSTAQDGVYFLEIRDSFVLQNKAGGNYRFDMRKLQGRPPSEGLSFVDVQANPGSFTSGNQ